MFANLISLLVMVIILIKHSVPAEKLQHTWHCLSLLEMNNDSNNFLSSLKVFAALFLFYNRKENNVR